MELVENVFLYIMVMEVKMMDGDFGIYGYVIYYIVNDFVKDRFYINERG